MHKPHLLSLLLSSAAVTTAAGSVVAQSATFEDGNTTPSSLHTNDSISTLRLNSAVITGTRTPKTLADTPIRTRLITAEDIRKSDATNVQELLQHELPGVEFSYAMSQQINMNLTGFSGQGVLFLVDGERLAGETMDNVDFARIGLCDVERVEIVKGAASALYGSNAAGGVINIITRKHTPQPWTLSLDARRSDHDERRLGVQWGLNRKKWSNALAVTHTHLDSYSLKNPIDVAHYTKYALHHVFGGDTWQVKERVSFQPSDDLRLSTRAGYFFRQRYFDAGENNHYRDFSGGAKAEWTPTLSDRFELSYAFDQYDKSDYYLTTRLDIRDYSNVQHSVRGLYSHDIAHLTPNDQGATLAIGADFMRDYLMTYQFNGESRRQNSADVFAQFDWSPTERWEVIGALRYDYFSLGHQHQPTAKLSARYRNGNLTLRGGYGSGFRAPSLKEKFMHFHLNDIFIIRGHETIRPEKSHNFHLSAEWNKGRLHFETAGSYTMVNDRITTSEPTTERDPQTRLPYVDYLNIPRLHVFTYEATGQNQWRIREGRLTARMSYAFTKEQVRDAGTLAPYMPSRPHSLTARLDYDRRHSANYAYSFLLSGRFLSSIDGTEYNTVTGASRSFQYPAYCLLKLAFQQSFGKAIRVNLAADNLLNYRPHIYYYNSPTTTGINLSLGLVLDLHAL